MKNVFLVTAIVGATLLASCGSHRNFNTRKYTKGSFHLRNKSMKSERYENQADGAINSTQKAIIPREIQPELTIVATTDAEIFDHPLTEESTLTSYQAQQNIQTNKSNSTETIRSRAKEVKPHPQLSPQKELKPKKEKKSRITKDQKRSRFSLIMGITALTLALTLLTIALLGNPIFGTFAFHFIGRSMRLVLIPAIFGLTYSLLPKNGKEHLGKYEGYRRAGFWLSISTIILWIILF